MHRNDCEIVFSEENQHFNLPNAELIYMPNFFSKVVSDTYFETLKTDTNWQHDDITVFGKTYKQPRLTALFGKSNQPYGYSNIVMHPEPLTPTLKTIQQEIESIAKGAYE